MSNLSKTTIRFAFIVLALLTLILLSLIFSYSSSRLTMAATSNGPMSYVSAVDIASPSVVSIYTAKIQKRHYSSDPMIQQYLNQKARVNGKLALNLGSGVVMDKNGHVITNYHVVKNASAIQVALKDGRRTTAKIIGADPETDLAILKIHLFGLRPIRLESANNIEVGEVALAIGNAFGLEQTVTQGIISAKGRRSMHLTKFENFIQTDAAINPGNSGGALVDTEGKLLGINTAIISKTGGSQGIGFAIPAMTAKNIMTQIIKTGHASRGWLGVNIQQLTSALAAQLGAKTYINQGIVITKVLHNTPAAISGLKQGDLITRINNQAVKSPDGFLSQIALLSPNSAIKVTVLRNGNKIEIPVTLGKKPSMQAMNQYTQPFILQ